MKKNEKKISKRVRETTKTIKKRKSNFKKSKRKVIVSKPKSKIRQRSRPTMYSRLQDGKPITVPKINSNSKNKLERNLNKDFEKLFKSEKTLKRKKSFVNPIELQNEISLQFYRHELKLEKENLKVVQIEFNKYRDLPKNRKIKYEGKSRKYWSVISIILNKSKEINNLISEYENEINKLHKIYFKKNKFKVKDTEYIIYYPVWKLNECQADVDDVGIDYVAGMSKKFDYDLIMKFLNEVFTIMESRDILAMTFNLVNFKSRVNVITDYPFRFKELQRQFNFTTSFEEYEFKQKIIKTR